MSMLPRFIKMPYFRISSCALLLLTVCTVGYGQNQEFDGLAGYPAAVQEAMQAGQTALQEGRLDAAIEAFTQVVVASQESYSPALLGRAEAFTRLRESQAAVEDYTKVINTEEGFGRGVSPALVLAYNGRGEARLAMGGILNMQDALSDFTKAAEYSRTNAQVAANLGETLVRLGGAQQAVPILDRAIKFDETLAQAYRARAQAHAAMEDFDAARADMEKAIELEPDSHENHYVTGIIYMQAGNHEKSVEAFHQAADTYQPEDPNDKTPYVDPMLAAALAYIEMGKSAPNREAQHDALRKSIAETDKAIAAQPALPLGLLNRGVALRLMGYYGDAIQAFSQAIDLNPEFSEAYFRRGIVWYYSGKPTLARKDFQRAISINFEDVRPYLWLGFTYVQEGDFYKAVEAYGDALNVEDRYVDAYVNRGLAYAQLGDFEKAAIDFNNSILFEPTKSLHHYRLGTVFAAMEDYEKAAEAFASAINFNRAYVDAYRGAADALDKLGKQENAAELRTQADEIEAEIKRILEEGQAGDTGETTTPDSSSTDPSLPEPSLTEPALPEPALPETEEPLLDTTSDEETMPERSLLDPQGEAEEGSILDGDLSNPFDLD